MESISSISIPLHTTKPRLLTNNHEEKNMLPHNMCGSLKEDKVIEFTYTVLTYKYKQL